jgi:hypothetical protein
LARDLTGTALRHTERVMQLEEFSDTERFVPGSELTLPDMARHGGNPVPVRNYLDRNSGDSYQVCESAGFFRKSAAPNRTGTAAFGPWKRLISAP